MEIYKEHLLEALETEPLSRGNWCEGLDDPLMPANRQSCTVCAVGSVLRHFSSLLPNQIRDECWYLASIDNGATNPDDLEFLPLPDTWFGRISLVWESIQGPIKDARVHMIDWTEENVPENEVLWEIYS